MEVKKLAGPFLVIVPLAVLSNWQLELARWLPSATACIYKGAPEARGISPPISPFPHISPYLPISRARGAARPLREGDGRRQAARGRVASLQRGRDDVRATSPHISPYLPISPFNVAVTTCVLFLDTS